MLVAAGVVADTAGNANAASNALVRTIDRVLPVPILSANVPSLTNQSNFVLTVEFGKAVTGFTVDDIVASGATLTNLQSLGGGRFTLNVSAVDGPVTFNLAAGVVADIAGNANVAATSLGLTVDSIGLQPTLGSTTLVLSNASSFPLSIDFGAAAVGFAIADLTVLGGVASNLVTVDAATGKYSATVTPSADGSVTVLLPANAATDLAGNGNAAAVPLVRTFDRTVPTAVLTTTVASRTNATTFDVFANFGEPIVGLSKSDFVVAGATASDPVSLGNGRYSVTLSNASGLVTIDLGAGAVTDIAGNANLAATRLSVTVDTSALVPLLSSSSVNELNTATFPVTVVFGQEVTGFAANKATVIGGTVSNFVEVDRVGGRYTFDVTATADGVVSVIVSAAVVKSLAGSDNVASNTLIRTIDRVAPTPIMSIPVSGITNQSTFDVSVDLGGAVNGFALTDFVASGAVLSNLRGNGVGRYLVTATANDGPVTLALPAGAVTDLAGNASLAASPLAVTVDTTAVTPSIATTTPLVSSSSTITVAVNFGEVVTGFALTDLTVVNGTASDLQTIDAATGKYSLTVTPTSDGLVTVQVAGAAARDAAGNATLASSVLSRTIDRTSLPVVLSTNVATITNQTTFDVSVDFGETVTGFTLADVSVSSGTKSNFVILSGARYQFTFTGTNGTVTISVPAGAAVDAAGNATPASAPLVRTIDSVGLTPTISAAVSDPTNVASFLATIVFGEPVVGFTLSDLAVLGGAASNLTVTDAASGTYSVTITPSGDGTLTVLLPAGVVDDVAGNKNAAAVPLVRTVDRTAPSVVLTTDQPARTNTTSFNVIAEFGETVTGLTASDVTVSGGTVGTPVLLSPGRYSLPITATPGAVSISLAAGAVTDAAGNTSTASNTIALTVDTAALVPVLSSTSANVLATNVFDVNIVFGKAVTGFTLSDLTLINATASNFVTENAVTGTYKATITATADGAVTVLIPAGVVADTAGNANAVSNLLSRSVDRVTAVPVITTSVPVLTNQTNFVATVDFGKDVTGFALTDVMASGATLSSLQSQGGGRFTMNVTATGGPVSLSIAAGAATDLAGTASAAASPVSLTVDAIAPLPALSSAVPSLTNQATMNVAIALGEEVVGLELADIAVVGGIASSLVEVDRASGAYTVVVTPSADGLVTVRLPAGSVRDLAGNFNVAATPLSRTFDRTAPSPTLTTSEPTRTNKTTFTMIANFGAAVTGLTKSDLLVTGAVASDAVDLGNGRYEFTLSGASGLVEAQLVAGAVTDAAGNASLASSVLSLTVDTTAVVPSLTSASANVLATATFPATVVFGKQVIGFTASQITVLGGSVSGLVETDVASGTYTFNVQATADGSVTVLVPAGVVRDTAGNANVASSPLVRRIDRVAPRPLISTGVPNPTNQSSFNVSIDFAEEVTGFDLSKLIGTGVVLSDFRVDGVGRYLVTASAVDGPVSFSIAAGASTDAAGNTSLAATPVNLVVDTQAVTPTITSTAALVGRSDTLDATVEFGEAVTGFVLADLVVTGATASDLQPVAGVAGKYNFTLTPTADGAITARVIGGAARDAAGNITLSSNILSRTIDRAQPSVVLTTSEPSRTNRSTFDVIANFGELVSGLTASDLVITGATASEPQSLGGGRYSFTITAFGGPVSMSIPAGAAQDLAGNTNTASSTLSLTVDTAALVPTLTSTSLPLLSSTSFDVSLVFGKAVVGFDVGDITVLGGTASNLVIEDAATGRYSYTVTADGDGAVTTLVSAGVTADDAGNTNLSSGVLLRFIDTAAPTVVLRSTVGTLTSLDAFDVDVTFSEVVTGLTLGQFVVTGATPSGLQSLGAGRFTLSLTGADGSVSIALPGASAQDLAGNNSIAASPLAITVDRSTATPTLATTVANLSNAASLTVTADFGKQVTGFDASDLVLSGASASGFTAVDVTIGRYSFVLTPTGDGPLSVFVPQGAARDTAGNLTAASNRLSRTVDRTAPAPILTSLEPSQTNRTDFDITVDFGEVVTGFTSNGLTVSGATAAAPQDLGNGRYSIRLSDASSVVSVQARSGAATDAAGNSSLASTTLSFTVDTTALVPVVTSSTSPLISSATFDVAVAFGKQVVGFTAAKVTLINATLSNFVESDAASGLYTFDVTATADGPVSVLVAGDVVRDLSGTLNATSNRLVRTVDRVAPTPVLTASILPLSNQTSFIATINFTESVNGFELSDLGVVGGTAENLRDIGGGRYTVDVVSSASIVTLSLAGNVAVDSAGNANKAATPITFNIDSLAPTPTLSSTAPIHVNSPSFPVAVVFGERVTGFTETDLLVIGGTASGLSTVDLDTGSYTFDVTPNGDGIVTVLVPAGSARDSAGNFSESSTALNRFADATRPVPQLSTNQPAITNKSVFDVTVEFVESVSGLEQGDLVVSGGTASQPRVISDRRYTFTITADNGPVEISLAADAVSDTSGNLNVESNTLSLNVDTTAIVPVLTTSAPSVVTSDSFSININFGKSVLSFDVSDIAVIGGSVSALTVTDAGLGQYTATVTATGDGSISVSIPTGVTSDAAGNSNAASNVLTRHFDRTPPAPTLTFLTAAPGQTTREVEVAFSEPVVGFDPSDLIISGGTVGSLVRNRDNTVFSVLVTPTSDGDLTVDLPAGVAKDAAGLDNTSASQVVASVDITQPVPTLSGSKSSTAGQFDLVISFSEPVTGLTATDFQLTNATLSNLTGSGTDYTATLTAIIEGDITASLPDERVVDAFGNRNVESNVVTLVHRVVDSIVLEHADETIDMRTHDETVLATVKTIDIRGTGRNSLVLDAAKIAALTPNKTLVVIADQGDSIDFGDGWQFETVEAVNGQLQRIFTNGTATVRVVGPQNWTNPVIVGDVNGSGDVTAGDALDILFSLNQPQLFDSQGMLVDAASVAASNFRFYDTNEDGMSTAADALFVINVLFLQSLGGSGEGESAPVQSALLSQRSSDEDDHNVTLSVEQLDLGISSKVKTFGRNDVAVPVAVAGDIDSEVGDPSEEFGDIDAILASVLNWSL